MLEHYGLWLALGCAVLAIVYGIVSARWVVAQPSGNARMREIAAAIRKARVPISTGNTSPFRLLGQCCSCWSGCS